MAEIILVSLKSVDEEGSALLACTGIQPDPLIPGNLILEGVRGLSWPFQKKWVNVNMWSVEKGSINYWMAGTFQDAPNLTPDVMAQGKVQVPHPPKTTPVKELVNNPEDVQALIRQAQGLIDKSKKAAPAGGSPITGEE